MNSYKVKRLIAYAIDFFLVSIIITLLCNIRALNPKYSEYEEAYEKYVDVYESVIHDDNQAYIINPELENLMYQVSKYSISFDIIRIVVVVAYFTLFPLIFNGQTIGKRIAKLRLVHKDDDKKIKFYTYFFRSLIYPIFSSGIFFCAFSVACGVLQLVIFRQNYFLTLSKFILVLNLVWGYSDSIFCLSRKDYRSLHDLITKTKVIEVK